MHQHKIATTCKYIPTYVVFAFITLSGVGVEFVLIMNIRIKSSLLHLHSLLRHQRFFSTTMLFSVCFLLLRNILKINDLLCYYLLLCIQSSFNNVLRWDLLIRFDLRFGSVGQFRISEFLVCNSRIIHIKL